MSRVLITCGATAILILTSGPAAAQDAAPFHVSVGALGAIGFPGGLATLRVSAIGSHVGFDIDWGSLRDPYGPDDRFVAGQLRFLPTRRKSNGTARSFLLGFTSLSSTDLTSQFGIGHDWLGHRWRVGFDMVMGGHGIFLKMFVAWGGR